MFIHKEQIRKSIESLKSFHPFYGITFLVCKQAGLSIGSTIKFPINKKETEFLDQYFKPEKNSKYYYQVFKTSKPSNRWLSPKYASSSSQSTRTRGDLAHAFIHEKDTDIWGWQSNYVEILSSHLTQKNQNLIPAFYLSIWLYRERDWPSNTKFRDIIDIFFEEFLITQNEKELLFNSSLPEDISSNQLFQNELTSSFDLQSIIGKPPDSPVEEGGTLYMLEIQGVGPAHKLVFKPGERLTLITGDNGLGKTFILDCSWWSLTNKWAGLQAYPQASVKEAWIKFQISGDSNAETIRVSYDWQTQTWKAPKKRPTIPGLLVYAKVDGSFAFWDPAREYLAIQEFGEDEATSHPYIFTKEEVWDGSNVKIRGRNIPFINGLLEDWVQWQSRPETSPFNTLKKVLARLSPPSQSDLGTLYPGEPIRIPLNSKLIPTIKHLYGTIPIIYASAGVRRIITLAYLIVWAWEEHKIQSNLIRKQPQKRMVILIDELEAHLHPQWQRAILAALLDVREDLENNLQMQLIVATHSPMIMASVETRFNTTTDKLFLLEINKNRLLNGEVQVQLNQLPFIRQGRIDSWLTSEVFGLSQSRSIEGEQAIHSAKLLQEQDAPNSEEVKNISNKLRNTLSENDEFWPRWLFFARQHGALL